MRRRPALIPSHSDFGKLCMSIMPNAFVFIDRYFWVWQSTEQLTKGVFHLGKNEKIIHSFNARAQLLAAGYYFSSNSISAESSYHIREGISLGQQYAFFRFKDGLPSFWRWVLAGHLWPSFSATSLERRFETSLFPRVRPSSWPGAEVWTS